MDMQCLLKERRTHIETRRVKVDKVRKLVDTHWKRVTEVAKKRSETKAAKRERERLNARFHAELKRDAAATVLREMPPGAGCFVDEKNGRYRVRFPGKQNRSFSWTIRGDEKAALCALECMWEWQTEHDGTVPPAHLGLRP